MKSDTDTGSETEIIVEGGDSRTLGQVQEQLAKAILAMEDPWSAIVARITTDELYTYDEEIRKALSDHENETVRKFAANLHPEEAKIVERVLVAWQGHQAKIVDEVAKLISGKSK